MGRPNAPRGTPTPPTGFHHVTGIAGGARENVDCYAGALGLAFLVRTVNFEDVLVPHLYYGDRCGSLGSILTFFPFGETDSGRIGPPQPTAVGLAVPEGALSYWTDRLERRGIDVEGPIDRFDERVLRFADPDGTRIELVATADADSRSGDRPSEGRIGDRTDDSRGDESRAGDGTDVPGSARVRRIRGVTLQSVNPYATAAMLETFGFERVGGEGDRFRYRAGADETDGDGNASASGSSGDGAAVVDVLDREGAFGREGPGTLHHVALRVPDRKALLDWHALFRDRGADVSRIKDRHFFRSLYVREPGGILFELATETPGLSIAADHSPRTSIYLPGRFEHQRDLVESQHPVIRPPAAESGRGSDDRPPGAGGGRGS